MFDDLRQQLIQNDSEPEQKPKQPKKSRRAPRQRAQSQRNILGLTPGQGFFLALMVFLNVCVLGAFALVAMERVRIPGL